MMEVSQGLLYTLANTVHRRPAPSALMRCQLCTARRLARPWGTVVGRNTTIRRHNGIVVRAEAAEASEAPAHKSGEAWFQHMKAEFDPVSSAPPTTAVLDFEKPLVELDRRIREVRVVVDPIATFFLRAGCVHERGRYTPQLREH